MHLVTILHHIGTSCNLATICRANLAVAIRSNQAIQSVSTWIAISAAINVRFDPIFSFIGARRLGANHHRARLALTIRIHDACHCIGAWLTICTAAIYVRFQPVFRSIDAELRYAMVLRTHRICGAIVVGRAFDTRAITVTNHRAHGAFRTGRCGHIRRLPGHATRVDGAFFAVVHNVGLVEDAVDAISHSVALIAFAVVCNLLGHGRSIGRDDDGTSTRNASTFAAFIRWAGTIGFGKARNTDV
jgi:hypothetical protein